jgi:hypothetical protein
MIRNIFLGLVVPLAAQFVRPQKNLAATTGPNDINVRHPVPAGVQTVLQRACYDCHSNHTNYPWYAGVQPVGWWLNQHVNDGRRHLNFSEFGAYPAGRAAKKMAQVTDEVEQHTMPLKSYTWMHAGARLSPAEIKLLADWAESVQKEISGS